MYFDNFTEVNYLLSIREAALKKVKQSAEQRTKTKHDAPADVPSSSTMPSRPIPSDASVLVSSSEIPEAIEVSSGDTGRENVPLDEAPVQAASNAEGVGEPSAPAVVTEAVVRESPVSTAAADVPGDIPEEVTLNVPVVDEEGRVEETGEVPLGQDRPTEGGVMGETSGNPHFVNFRYDKSHPLRDDQDELVRWA